MKFRLVGLVSLCLFLSFSRVFAGWSERPQLRWTQKYSGIDRRENHELYINRVSAVFTYSKAQEKQLLKLVPFFEIRRNLNMNLWERKELGVEVGKDIFSWFYIGEGLQYSWSNEDFQHHGRYKKRDSGESETRLVFSHNLLPDRFIKVRGYFLSEYTYDFERGAGVRNEIGTGFIVPICKYAETDINWKHVDRIGYYDCDMVEAAVTLIF